jgi:hypothetical protein
MAAGKAGLFQGLLNLVKSNKGVIGDAATSAGLVTGLGLLGGQDPVTAMKYGAADFALSYPATLAVRGLRGKKPKTLIDKETGKEIIQPGRSALELPANIAASVTAGLLVDKTNPAMQQQEQIAQQALQRDAINQMGLIAGMPNAYSPGTMFQMQGMEPTYARSIMQQMMQQNPGVDMASMERDMAQIVGV